MHFLPIEYLRWARRPESDDPDHIPLTYSGMLPPDPALMGPTGAAALLKGFHGDHPPLAHDLAAVWGLKARQVLVQPGSHWSILALVAARLRERPGPVAVEFPCYEPLLRIPQFLGADIVRVERSPDAGWRLREETLAALQDRFPTLLLISHPHNPTGATMSRDELDALSQWALATGCAVLSDEVYLEFDEDWADRSALKRVAGAAVVRSFTKVMGLGALRTSAIAGPEEWIAEVARFTDYGPVMLPAPSHELARRAWSRREALWTRAREAATEGRSEVAAWLKRMGRRVEGTLPPRGIICFLRLEPGLHQKAVAWARGHGDGSAFGYGLDPIEDGAHVWIGDLRRRTNVQLTPGAFFEDPRSFRLGFGVPAAQVREGLSRVQRYLERIEEES